MQELFVLLLLVKRFYASFKIWNTTNEGSSEETKAAVFAG